VRAAAPRIRFCDRRTTPTRDSSGRRTEDPGIIGDVPILTRVGSTVSERLAEHVVGTRFEDLPADVVEHAKDLLIHHLSLAFQSRATAEGSRAVDVACALGAGASTIVADVRRAGLSGALLANADLVAMSPIEDFHTPSGLHLGRMVWPAGWTLAEHVHASGRDLLSAGVLAYDTACALSDQSFITSYKRRPTHVFAPIAVATLASKLLGQDTTHVARVIASSAHLGIGYVDGDSHLWNGFVAQNAVALALLSDPTDRDGLTAIESPKGLYVTNYGRVPIDLDARLAALGREYGILGASTKRYPSSGSHIVPLDLSEELVQRHRIRADDVTRVVVTLAGDYRDRFAHMEAGADMAEPSDSEVERSLRIKLALLLVEGRITYQPRAAHARIGGVRETVPKIELRFELPSLDDARVELYLRDGRVIRDERAFAPYPKGDWGAWLRRDGERFLTAGRLAELERRLTALEEVDDIGSVLALTVPDRQTQDPA
jgi:2-methylcitrate dehydratase PrpD